MHDILFNSILILKEIYLMSSPHHSPFIFVGINFVNFINWNYKIKILLILKRFKTNGDVEIVCQKERWQQSFIKNGTLG